MAKSSKKLLQTMVAENGETLLKYLADRFVEIPSTVCDCGKPVIFSVDCNRFECSRCGQRWKLIVVVKKVPSRIRELDREPEV